MHEYQLQHIAVKSSRGLATVPLHCWGSGEHLVIALHGFSQTGENWAGLASAWPENWTLCAPDLPFHGNCQWPGAFFSKRDIKALLEAIATHFGTSSFGLLAYSMGGRLAICVTPLLQERVQWVGLLAPAGVGSFVHHYPKPLRRITEWATAKPQWRGALMGTWQRMGLISSIQRNYAEKHLGSSFAHRRFFRIGDSMPHFKTDNREISRFWLKTQLPAKVVLGQHDRLIQLPPARAYFQRNPNITIHEVAHGHDLLHPDFVKMALPQPL